MNVVLIFAMKLSAIGGTTYIEIGVDNGELFQAINADSKIGIDPIAPHVNVKNLLKYKHNILIIFTRRGLL